MGDDPAVSDMTYAVGTLQRGSGSVVGVVSSAGNAVY
jgi:hypothetical protein